MNRVISFGLFRQVRVLRGIPLYECRSLTPFFIGRTHFCATNLRIWYFFGQEYLLCSPGNQHYQKILYLFIFIKKVETTSNKNTTFAFLISTFLMKKLKNEYFSDDPGFLGYIVNISFLAEQLPYSQISGTKVGPS